MLRDVLAILADPRFEQVFAPGSRAEVPIVGHLTGTGGEPLAVTGQIDRLVIAADNVLIADYKTDATVPATLGSVPPRHVEQLALYCALLARLYPAKRMRAALVFTTGPVLMELPAAALDHALADVLRRSPAA